MAASPVKVVVDITVRPSSSNTSRPSREANVVVIAGSSVRGVDVVRPVLGSLMLKARDHLTRLAGTFSIFSVGSVWFAAARAANLRCALVPLLRGLDGRWFRG